MNKLLTNSYVCVAILLIVGCKKFVDVNTNPNIATKTSAAYVLSGALSTSYRNQVSTNLMIVPGTWTGYYAHSNSFTGGGAEKTYEFTNADFNAFDVLFDNIADYQYIIDHADNDGVPLWKDPAAIMQCYVFQQLVDLYGDIPYSQALKGIENIAPVYDNQKTIYENLIVRLDQAMTNIANATWPTASEIVSQDVYFKGSKDKWIRFANTLKLRILMRQSFMAGRDSYISTNINNTISRGYIQENVLCSPGYQAIAGKLNPFYNNFGYNELNNVVQNHQFRKTNAVMINWLKNSNTTTSVPPASTPAPTANADTFRLQSLAWPAGSTPSAVSSDLSEYVGIPMGIGGGFSTSGSSPIGPFQIQVTQGLRPGMLMLLAESYFLQAEAAQRYGIVFSGGSAQQLYETGILAHFRTCAAPSTAGNIGNAGDAFANRYFKRTIENIGWDASTDKIKAILLQKWISLYHINGLEAWSEYRKASGTASVGVPANVKSVVVSASDPEPVRYLYPQTELNANSNKVPKNIDRFTSKIFWDVN